MRPFDRNILVGLLIFALLAAVFGVGTIIHAYTVTKPGIARIESQASKTLRMAERAVKVLDEHPERLDRLGAPRESLVDTVSNVHFVVQQSAAATRQAADALDATAQSLRSIPSTSELFLPAEKLAGNAHSLTKTADALRHMGPRLDALEKSTRHLSDTTTQSSEAAAEFNDEWIDAGVTLGELVERLQGTRTALEKANLSVATARQVSLQGGIYLLFSVVLLGMAAIWKRLCELPRSD